MAQLKLTPDIATKLMLLDGISQGDWITILTQIGQDPSNFFEGGVWTSEDFSMSNMRGISFRNAVLDGAIFRQEDEPFIDLSAARSCIEVNFVQTPSMWTAPKVKNPNIVAIKRKLPKSIPADQEERYISLDSPSSTATPICNSMANRSSNFVEAMEVFHKSQHAGSIPFQPNLNTYQTLLFKGRSLANAMQVMEFLASAKPEPVSPSIEIWHQLIAKATNSLEASEILDLATSWNGPIKLPDYDMYIPAIKLSESFETALHFFQQSKGAIKTFEYGDSLLLHLEEKIETSADMSTFRNLVEKEIDSDRFSQIDRHRALIRSCGSKFEALTIFKRMNSEKHDDERLHINDGAVEDLISYASSTLELIELLRECEKEVPYLNPERALLARVASVVVSVWDDPVSWQFVFDFLDSVNHDDMKSLILRTEALLEM